MNRWIPGLALLAVVIIGTVYFSRPVTTLEITNNTGEVIQHLYLSSQTSLVYGSDRIGEELLRPGETLHVRLRGCTSKTYDLRAISLNTTKTFDRRVQILRCGGIQPVEVTAG